MKKYICRMIFIYIIFTILFVFPAVSANLNLDSLLTVNRAKEITTANITADLIYTKELYKMVEERINFNKTLKRNVYLTTAEINFTIAGMAIINTETMLALNELEAADKDMDFALRKLKIAQLALMPSRVVEARGMYLDGGAIPKTKEGIRKLCSTLKEAGFNMIYPEVFRRGYTIYPGNLTELDPEFAKANFDVLKVLVSEAHKNGMEIHPWIWTFRVKSPKFGNPLLSKLPALKAVPYVDENQTGEKEFEPLFLSPADPQSREYILLLLKEIISNYDIDGILLDYIRYNEDLTDDTITLTKFRMEYLKQYGKFPPLKIEQGMAIYAQWQLFRENQINQMVQMASEELSKIKPDIYIGVAVFRNETHSRVSLMQHWRHWANNSWITYISPMLYTSTASDLNIWLDWETDKGKRFDWLYPILGAHRFSIPEDIFAQLSMLNKRKIPGMAIFALVHFNPITYEDLKLGPFRKPAYLPHRSPTIAVKKIFKELELWILKLNKDEETANQYLENYAINLKNLSSSIPPQTDDINYLNSLLSQIESLQEKSDDMVSKNQISANIGTEIIDQTEYAKRLLKISIQRLSNKNKYIESTLPPVKILPETKEIPSLKALKVNSPPQINGKLDDPVWQIAEKADKFYWNTGIGKSSVNTTVQVVYDNNNIYFAFENEEPDMDLVSANDRIRDSGTMFVSDDSIEVFLLPDLNKKSLYYHFAVNTINTKFDAKGKDDVKWNGKWQSAVQNFKNKWVVELSVPFSDLEVSPPLPGSEWKANFCRNRFEEPAPFNVWSVPYGSYHNVDRFGILDFNEFKLY